MPPAGLRFTDVAFFYFKYRLFHSTTVGRIAMRIVALTPSMKKITATNLVNFGPVTPEILRRICMGGDCT